MISPRSILRAILGVDDTPHAIALGTAVGVFIGMTPTFGIQMLLVGLLAVLTRRLFYFNTTAALLSTYVSNPITLVPIYWFNYGIGCLFYDSGVTREEFAELIEYHSLAQWWDTVAELFVDVGWPLMAGSLMVGAVCAAVAYPLMRIFVRQMHESGQPPALLAPKRAPLKPGSAAMLRRPTVTNSSGK